MRKRWVPMLLVLSLPAAAGAQEPCTDPADACAEALLDAFQPHLFFEDDGPAGVRIDFPTDFVGADDDTVENNFEHLFGGPAYGVYRNAVRLETDEAPCWLLQYHFYFAANWHPDIWEADGYTHEHDWEWVYVLAGWSWRLGRYVGFAATLSQHDRDNLDAAEAALKNALNIRLGKESKFGTFLDYQSYFMLGYFYMRFEYLNEQIKIKKPGEYCRQAFCSFQEALKIEPQSIRVQAEIEALKQEMQQGGFSFPPACPINYK